MGERSPINDASARALFYGMRMDTTRADLLQAVLEGVAFALRDSVEVARSLGLPVTVSRLCGGGAKSPLWRKILANVLNVTLLIPAAEEGPGYGGAMLALVGCGTFESVGACRSLIRIKTSVEPDAKLAALYEARYQKFRLLYPALKEVFPRLR